MTSACTALRPGDRQRVRAIGPGIEHRQALAAAEQVDFHQVCFAEQKALSLAEV